METPQRQYRSTDEEYDLVSAKARKEGVSISHATREALRNWVTGDREFYVYGENGLMGTVALGDREALDNKLRGMDLWPVEWGDRTEATT